MARTSPTPISYSRPPGASLEDEARNPAEEEVHALLQARPRSNIAGTFPREMLPPGEAVLFETRPAFFPYVSQGLVGGAILVLFGSVLYATAATTASDFGDSSNAGFIQGVCALLVLAGVATIAAPIIRWYHTSYAITNRRVAKKAGVYARRVIDARFEKIQCVTLTETSGSRLSGYGNLLFSVSAQAWGSSVYSGLQAGGILWVAIRDPIEVRAFMERVSALDDKWNRTGAPLQIVEE